MGVLNASNKMFADDKRLKKIDKLMEIGVGEYISLPQLVVVGDQSSGKSSVLEGLTGLPFPRDSTLCTRFATQIVFRRADVTSHQASIIPSKSCSSDEARKLRAFKHTCSDDLTAEEFADILLKASDAMGLARPGTNDQKEGKPTFSEHTFRVELHGPDHSHFSVVDVPGIFRNPQEGVTTEDDIPLVQRMVRGYIESDRSIIMAVIPANVDIATQDILNMAKEVDPKGQRTLGILTKPDLIDKGAEQDAIDILAGRKYKLKLGYHAVRNRGKAENDYSVEQRNAAEALFFDSGPFEKVSKNKVGIVTLQIRLQALLNDHTEREFPHVKTEINGKITACEKELKALGPSRATDDEIRRYLLQVANRFQKYVTMGVEARYGADPFFRKDKLRLATLIIDRNERFANDVRKLGFAIPFVADNEDGEDDDLTKEIDLRGMPQIELSILLTSARSRFPAIQDVLGTMYDITADEIKVEDDRDLEDEEDRDLEDGNGRDDEDDEELSQLIDEGRKRNNQNNVLSWIKRRYIKARGFEIGSYNPSILPLLFREQTAAWEPLAKKYISSTIIDIHHFSDSLLTKLCVEERVKIALRSAIQDDQLRIYKKATEQVGFILETERRGNLMTMNHYFSDTLEKVRHGRHQKEVTDKVKKTSDTLQATSAFNSEHSVSWSTINDGMTQAMMVLPSAPGISNLDHTVRDLHDILKAYYKVAMKRFIDNICMMATDYHLVSGPQTPLGVFSPEFVGGMSSEKLAYIAGEAPDSIQRRQELTKQIESLKEGKQILTAD